MKRVVAALIVNDGRILACQRTRHQPMPLKWEFPGGKIEDGEQPREALRRELEEELGIEATIGDEVVRIHHEYPGGGSIDLRFFEVPGTSERIAGPGFLGGGPHAGEGSGGGEVDLKRRDGRRGQADGFNVRRSAGPLGRKNTGR